MSCNCTTSSWEYSHDDWETGEPVYELVKRYATVDLDVGRYKCTICGEIGYYTGHWKKYFEEGIPCPGVETLK